MFGLGRITRRRSSTFSSGRLRNAAIAGAGMLALRWWQNRQAKGKNTTATNPKTGSQGDRAMPGYSG
jgi:hypothetical protein